LVSVVISVVKPKVVVITTKGFRSLSPVQNQNVEVGAESGLKVSQRTLGVVDALHVDLRGFDLAGNTVQCFCDFFESLSNFFVHQFSLSVEFFIIPIVKFEKGKGLVVRPVPRNDQ